MITISYGAHISFYVLHDHVIMLEETNGQSFLKHGDIKEKLTYQEVKEDYPKIYEKIMALQHPVCNAKT